MYTDSRLFIQNLNLAEGKLRRHNYSVYKEYEVKTWDLEGFEIYLDGLDEKITLKHGKIHKLMKGEDIDIGVRDLPNSPTQMSIVFRSHDKHLAKVLNCVFYYLRKNRIHIREMTASRENLGTSCINMPYIHLTNPNGEAKIVSWGETTEPSKDNTMGAPAIDTRSFDCTGKSIKTCRLAKYVNNDVEYKNQHCPSCGKVSQLLKVGPESRPCINVFYL